MSNYYTKQDAKVALASALRELDWKIYGFKADESDMMTDYWNPARWEGIATKNGYTLLIDQYGTGKSGYEVKRYNYSKTRSSSSKVAKLQAMIDDAATTASEKENAQNLIDKLNGKDTAPDYEVLEVYPTFEHKTPKSCVWHIEKDGVIIAKGKGLYNLYSINEREETKTRMMDFANKLEKHIADGTELVAVEKQVKSKTIELVSTRYNGLVANETIIKLNSNFTGGFYSGTTLVYTQDFGTRRIFVKLGKKHQKLKDTPTNSLTLNVDKLEKWIADGSISIVELKEVETITTKTVYVKQKRTQKPVAEEFQVESTVQPEQTEAIEVVQNETIETVQAESTQEITYKLNDEKNGVEIYSTDKPSEEVRDSLKVNGFRWSKYNKCWYAKQSEKTLALAESLAGVNVSKVEDVQPFEIELHEFVEITNYKISEETEKRLIDNSLFGDRRTVGRETNELQATLSNLLEETKQVIELTDNNYYKNKLIDGFNSFCDRYTREMANYLYQRSVSPSWAVTGRGNINVDRYNKKQDAIFNKMGKVVEMLDKQQSILKKYKNRFESEKVYKTKQAIQNAIDNLETTSLSFETRKREIEYYGYRYNTRSYESPNYFMMKVAACYRIFDRTTGKEVHSMKTTDKLTDAKKHVLYLEHIRASETA